MLSLAVSSPKSPNYGVSHLIQIRARRFEDDAHDAETSRRQEKHRPVAEHDLPSHCARYFSQAGEPGRARSGLVGGRSLGLVTAADRSEPQGQGVSQCALPTVGAGRRLKRKRHPNYRLVKIHRNYYVEEIAKLFGKHRNTVRDWIKRGLPTSDRKRPLLILGRDLAAFLQARRLKNKRTCQPGEIYCVRCRAPQKPAGDMAECQVSTATLGNLIGICPKCDCMMYRRVNLAKLEQVRGKLDITMTQAPGHIGESA